MSALAGTLADQHAALARGDLTSVELTTAALRAAREADARLNAFVVIDDEGALAAAADADRRRAAGEDGPLLGVPLAVKNDLDVAGRVTGWGSAAYTRPADADAPVVTALRTAGAVPIGTTTLPELAGYGFTESEHLGITRNPVDPSRTPGGSSGGSAAAVAAGVVAVATASDGAGSIRIPAACCGLPGIKPTVGTTPGEGWYGLAVQGCLTRTVADAAVVLDALGHPGALATAAATEPRPLRVGVDLRPFPMAPPRRLDPEVATAVREVAELLVALGHDVQGVRLRPGLAALAANARFLRGLADAAATADEPDRLEPRTREIARLGARIPDRVVDAARRQGERWGRRVLRDTGVDVLLTPTMRGPAPEIGRWAGRGGLATLLSMGRFYAHTPAWNHAGAPAVSLPAGTTARGLPLAVQLVAAPGEDALLVSLASQVERATTRR